MYLGSRRADLSKPVESMFRWITFPGIAGAFVGVRTVEAGGPATFLCKTLETGCARYTGGACGPRLPATTFECGVAVFNWQTLGTGFGRYTGGAAPRVFNCTP